MTRANTPYDTIILNSAIRTIVRKINKTKGVYIQPFTSHCFRHTFCSRGVRMGMPIKELQSITGHATAAMLLDRYSHADESKKNY